MIEYEFKQSDDSDILVVVFCGRDNVLNDQWDFYSLNEEEGVDVLWLKDRGDLWYQYEELEDVQELIDKDYSEIVTLGCSMGGYAAILFGLMIKADRILAFSPQTILDDTSILKDKWVERIKLVDPLWPDLKALSGNETVQGATVVFARSNTIDRKHAEYFPFEKAIEVPGSSHLSWADRPFREKLIKNLLTFT